MRILALHIGLPREVLWQGKKVSTGIFKETVTHPVPLGQLGFEGDGQADLKVHGGEHKAVYSYSSQFYDWWKNRHPARNYSWGIFGENLTIEGMNESECYLGDHFQVGSAILEATQPRGPCYKLGVRFGDPTIVREFLESERWGIYYRVVQTGIVKSGDNIHKILEHSAKIPVKLAYDLSMGKIKDSEKIQSLLGIPTLSPTLRSKLLARLASS